MVGASAEVVMMRAEGAVATCISSEDVWPGVPLSVTFVVKLEGPLDVGVPETSPVDAARVSPAGN